MNLVEKLEPIIIFSAVLIGILASNINIAKHTNYLINTYV